jgi:FlaA1/EpsC-like NDP-sugar epimerase
MAVDALLLAGALALAYQLRFDFGTPPTYTHQFRVILAVVVGLEIALLWAFGLYRRMTRFAGAGELVIIAGALTIVLLLGILHWLWQNAVGDTPASGVAPWRWPIPQGVLALNWLAATGAVGGARLARRVSLAWPTGRMTNARRALVVGATDVGDFAVRMLRRSPGLNLRPVAFLDESTAHTGRTVQGLPIVGSLSDLGQVLGEWAIDEVLIALPEAPPATVTRIVEQCRRHRVNVRVLPNEDELIAGQRALGSLRTVDIDELLGRERADERLEDELNYVRGQVVLITGAGGSIGSEICRQVGDLGPRAMVLIGRGENSLFELGQELERRHARGDANQTPDRHYVVADIGDEPKMRRLFGTYQPKVIFHAAAHKHVPLMENEPEEAVKNNILATDLLARLADEHGVERFVQISTDKAVRPSSIMGASKRIAEQVITDWASRSSVRFVSVRFGNVLGSRGSVIPIFRRQIEQGGPVTVTHPDAQRYFMTPQEATSLVLRAGAVADSGQLCVLDMGELVRIEDLARNLITLSGLEPERDIEIKHTGLRPGEKLKEEYLSAQEGLKKTTVGKVFVTDREAPNHDDLRADLEKLREAAQAGDRDRIREILRRRIPDHEISKK